MQPQGLRRGAHSPIEPAQSAHSHQPSQKSARDREHHAFQQKLANDGNSSCADGYANRDFPRSLSGTRQQHVGHVGAGNQQHKSNRSKQRKKQRLDVVQAADFHNRPHLGGNVLVCVGVLDGKSLGQRAEFQPCRLERHAIAKAPEQHQPASVAPLEGCIGNQWYPQIRVFRKPPPRRHHTDHHARHFVYAYGFAEDRGILRIAVAPNVVGKDDHRRRSRPFVLGDKVPAQHWLLLHHGKSIC